MAAAAELPAILPTPLSFASIVKGNSAQPPSPRTAKKSFAGVFSGQESFPVKPVSSFKGEPAVFFSKEDIEVLAKPFQFTLIGKFSFNSRPSMLRIRNFFISLGLKSLRSVGLLHESAILIHLSSEEEYTRLLFRAVWYVEGTAMKLFKWSPDFNPSEDSPVVPVWVGFSRLPIHFFNRSALFSIAKAVGNPLKSDESTALLSRPTVARVCIEVDISKEWPKRVWIGEEKNGFWQNVFVENPPLFCTHCKLLGHEANVCHRLHPSLLEEKKKQKREEEEEKKRKFLAEKEKQKDFPPGPSQTVRQNMVYVQKQGEKGSFLGRFAGSRPQQLENLSPPLGISLTPFPDLEKIKQKEGRKQAENGEQGKKKGKNTSFTHRTSCSVQSENNFGA